ncbi:MAG: glycosyltransferase family 9 protein [Desulfobulbaceae bacterium]|nr:glycosyltransferase family 9 protein [Desulfobulbaceae bacterium]HIJ79559.1 glycosyltransferase family 9 protein [Deltaproteobacteria bacterium]
MFIKGGLNLPIQNISNILLVQLGDIGDIVLSLPCIQALKENFPDANIVVAVRDKTSGVLEECPWISKIITIPEPQKNIVKELSFQMKFFSQLRRDRFELAIDLRTGTRGAILVYLSGAPRRIGFFVNNDLYWRKLLFTDLYRPELGNDVHMTDYLLSLLKATGVVVSSATPLLTVSMANMEKVQGLFEGKKIPTDLMLVAIQPFSLWKYKELGTEKIVQIIKRLRDKYGYPILITGSPADREQALVLVDRCGEGVYSLAGETTLATYAALLSRCGLFIGVDSAGQHIAAAVGVPTLTIYGPSKPASWAPQGEKHKVVQKQLYCVPCCQTGCENSHQSRCLDELTVEEVTREIDQHLINISAPVIDNDLNP